MKVTFIGATHEVTGSCSLLEVNGKNIIVDCGMEQGADIFENIEIPVAPSDIDAIVLTHAHIDHTGKVPFLVKNGYSGPIYSTEATRQLCDIMLMDSAHIQEFEAQWRNRKGKRAGRDDYVPLYTTEDAQNTMKLFRTAGYGTDVEIFDGVTINYTDAGHLLGSSSVFFRLREGGEERTILFSGDIGNFDKPLIHSPQTPPQPDYTVIESTYGNRLHGEKPDYVGELTKVIQRTLDRGGNVVIPAFAVGRTQELLYYLRIIKEEGLVKYHDGFPVIVDSPLAVEATNIYSTEMYEYYDDEALELIRAGINPVTFPDLQLSVSSDESKLINENNTPKIIISASGMCEAGRIRHHLKHNLWRPECTILFVGYQSIGTVGAKILDGAENVKLFGEDIQVRAEIKRLDAFSSHADENMLKNWLKNAPPKIQIFVNHGEDEVTESFARDASELIGKPAVAPYSGETWDLVKCEMISQAPIVPVIRKQAQGGVQISTERTGKNRSVYEELRNAGEGLIDLIEQEQGASNKEIKRLTREINELIAKYRA
ncbi:MAG: MBL fold metallo-hydrolase [Mogibacterium sp.]|nr:MBL fold metallo-hydrolase [Mogibacterium sp.]MBR2540569.1 MBL fold metallo-hydrolase [Mogibacterium sp.]